MNFSWYWPRRVAMGNSEKVARIDRAAVDRTASEQMESSIKQGMAHQNLKSAAAPRIAARWVMLGSGVLVLLLVLLVVTI
jgi:hypothetical protein